MSSTPSESMPIQPTVSAAETAAAGAAADTKNETFSNTPEQAGSAAETAQVVQQMPAIPLPPISLPNDQTGTTTPTTTDVSATTQTSTSKLLEDSDLIEKEWVDRAKKIVEANRDDPYKQSEELTVVKADYLKKRYDKNIKLK